MFSGFKIMKRNTKSAPAVAIIQGGANDGNFVCMTKKGGTPYIYVPDGELQQVPFKLYERDCLYIVGASGSGKSYYAGKFAEAYNKVHPNNPIVIISPKKEDASLDSLPNTIRIKLREENFVGADPEEVEDNSDNESDNELEQKDDYLPMWGGKTGFSSDEEEDGPSGPISLKELENSLVIFDDVEALTNNKVLRKGVNALRDKILTLGRSKKISTITISHQVTNRDETKIPCIESQFVTFFPAQPNMQLTRYFKTYLGLEEKVLKHMRRYSGDTRFITMHKNIPMFYFCNHMIGLITPDWIDSIPK